MRKFIFISTLLLFTFSLKAQQKFNISGTISNAKGEKLEAATVFIAGSQSATVTDSKGYFQLPNTLPGSYQIIISLIGYTSVKRDITLRDQSVVIDTAMQEKAIMLDVVSIGDESQRAKHLKTFLKYFLRESENAKSCTLLNPEKIEFSTNKTDLKASSEEFLIIENKNLGYRMKYLLQTFTYNSARETTAYDGEAIFEDLKGNAQQQEIWLKNRKAAYEGSLMHYLRSMYSNKARQEGFITYAIQNFDFPLRIAPNPVGTEQLVKHPDSTFMEFKYKRRLYTIYDKKKAAEEDKLSTRPSIEITMDKTGSVLMLHSEIDSRGSYATSKPLLIQGFWGRKRIADQLPLEYQPI